MLVTSRNLAWGPWRSPHLPLYTGSPVSFPVRAGLSLPVLTEAQSPVLPPHEESWIPSLKPGFFSSTQRQLGPGLGRTERDRLSRHSFSPAGPPALLQSGKEGAEIGNSKGFAVRLAWILKPYPLHWFIYRSLSFLKWTLGWRESQIRLGGLKP
jgi:hypothetical protein